MNEAFSLMWRDLTAAPLLAVLMVVPCVVSIRPVLRGSMLGWIAPIILVGQVVAWFYYYEADVPGVGLGAAMAIALAPWMVGAAAAMTALFTSRRRSPAPI